MLVLTVIHAIIRSHTFKDNCQISNKKDQSFFLSVRGNLAGISERVAMKVGALSAVSFVCEETCSLLTLLLDAEEEWPTLYTRDDNPEYHVDRQHPDDYKAISSPLPPEFIFHE
jgi:hypothetical protein